MPFQAPKSRRESRVLSNSFRVNAADEENKEPQTPLLSVKVLFCSPVSISFSTDLTVPNKSVYYSKYSPKKTVNQDHMNVHLPLFFYID